MSVSNLYNTAISTTKNIKVTSVTTGSLGNRSWISPLGGNQPTVDKVLSYNNNSIEWSDAPSNVNRRALLSCNQTQQGTASQSGTTISLFSGIFFDPTMVGGLFTFIDSGNESYVTEYVDTETLVAAQSYTQEIAPFKQYYTGFVTDQSANTTMNNMLVNNTMTENNTMTLTTSSNQITVNNTNDTIININTPSSAKIYTIYDANNDSNISLGISKVLVNNIENVTLNASDSGAIYQVTPQIGYEILYHLPPTATSKGVNYRFSLINISIPSGAGIISTLNDLNGYVLMNNGKITTFQNQGTILFRQTDYQLGDYIIIECDGNTWYTKGISTSTGKAFAIAPL